jgi:hypothetical protein
LASYTRMRSLCALDTCKQVECRSMFACMPRFLQLLLNLGLAHGEWWCSSNSMVLNAVVPCRGQRPCAKACAKSTWIQ